MTFNNLYTFVFYEQSVIRFSKQSHPVYLSYDNIPSSSFSLKRQTRSCLELVATFKYNNCSFGYDF
jgi:hypothetical protein